MLLIVAATLTACGGSDNGANETAAPATDTATQTEYVALLKRYYTPLHERFLETIGPCVQRQWKACEETGIPVREAAQTLLREMEGVTPPRALADEDAQLRKGVSALGDAIVDQHEAIAAKDEAAFDNSIDAVQAAIAEIDGAVLGINTADRSARLPTVH